MKKKQLWVIFLIVFVFVIFSPSAYAEGLSSDASAPMVGDTFTVRYSVANKVENVGAITLYINYDNSVLRATAISPDTASVSSGNGQISCVAPRDDSTGEIVVSWTEPFCSMGLVPEQDLLSVTFEVLTAAEESQIGSEIIVKGNNSSEGIGNDDLSGLTGTVNSSLVISTSSPVETDGATEPEIAENAENVENTENAENNAPATAQDEGKSSANSDGVINSTPSASAIWLITGIAIAILVAAILIIRKRTKKQ